MWVYSLATAVYIFLDEKCVDDEAYWDDKQRTCEPGAEQYWGFIERYRQPFSRFSVT